MTRLTIILISLLLTIFDCAAQISEYRHARRLYDKGMFSRSKMIFDQVADLSERKADPAGYALLCDVRAGVPGYVESMETFMARYPYSVLIPQVRFHHALNLFEAEDYKAALEQLVLIEEDNLYRIQRDEFVFKMAYCNLENGNIYSARDGFREVESRRISDYTAPSRYAIGYIEYNLKHFKEAILWFEKAGKDARFREMSDYYILECRFLQKDYEHVIQKGRQMYDTAPADRKSHLARIISESYLVRDDVDNARKYYDLSLTGGRAENTRADWFYGGSVLYAVGDYKGAIDNFTRMGERRDSIGQIASYNLGYSYVQTKNKVAAMDAFKEASQLTYDEAIAEDALFNYAKLAFDLNSDISVMPARGTAYIAI